MAQEHNKLRTLSPEKREAREAILDRVSQESGIPRQYLMIGKKKGVLRVSLNRAYRTRTAGYIVWSETTK